MDVQRSRINALTSTRAFAALAVIIFHFGCEVYPFNKLEHLFRNGNLAVSYFFVLSGVVMSWTYFGRKPGFGEYIRRRVARILPLYYTGLVLALLLPLYYFIRYSVPLEEAFSLKLLLNTLFLQAYVPEYALAINSPGWSLSVELFFYLLFPLLLKLQEGRARLFGYLTLGLFLASQAVHHLYHHSGPLSAEMHNFVFFFPLFHLNQFMLGMWGAAQLKRILESGQRINVWLVFFPLLVFIYFCPAEISLHNGLLAPVFLLLIISVSVSKSKLMDNRAFLFAGEISYGLYILQFPVYALMQLLNRKYFLLEANAFFYTYLLALIAVTSVLHYVVERPLRKVVLNMGTRSK